MLRSRTETWGALVVLAGGLLLAAILGLWAYVSTTPPLYPNAQAVPSVTDSAPLPKWGDAVAQGRQIVRAALTEHSLPGLSVAVGAGGDIVWAEGFGWADLEKKVSVAPVRGSGSAPPPPLSRQSRPACCWRKAGCARRHDSDVTCLRSRRNSGR